MFFNKTKIDRRQFTDLFNNVFIRLGIRDINSTYTEISVNHIHEICGGGASIRSFRGLKFIERYLVKIKKKDLKKFLDVFPTFEFINDSIIKDIDKKKFPIMHEFISIINNVLDRHFFRIDSEISFNGEKEYIVINHLHGLKEEFSYDNFIVDNISSFKFKDNEEDKLKMFNYLQDELLSYYLSPDTCFFSLSDIFPEFLEAPNTLPYCKMFFHNWGNIDKKKYFIKYLFDFLKNNFILPEFKYSKVEDNNIEDFILSAKIDFNINENDLFLYKNSIEGQDYEYLSELTGSYIKKYPDDRRILEFNNKIFKILLLNSFDDILKSLLDLFRFSCNYFSENIFNYHIYLLLVWYRRIDISMYRDLLNPRFKINYIDFFAISLDNFLIDMRDNKNEEEKLIFFMWFFFEYTNTIINSIRNYLDNEAFTYFLTISPVEWYISYLIYICCYKSYPDLIDNFYSGYLTLGSNVFNKYNDYIMAANIGPRKKSILTIISEETDDIKLLFYNLKFMKDNRTISKHKAKEIYEKTLEIFNKVKDSMPYNINLIEKRLKLIHLLIDYCEVEGCEICNEAIEQLNPTFIGEYGFLVKLIRQFFPEYLEKMNPLYGFEKIDKIFKNSIASQPGIYFNTPEEG